MSDIRLEASLFASDEAPELPCWSRTYCGYNDRFVRPFTLSVRDESGHAREVSVAQSVVASSSHAAEAQSSADGLTTASTVWDAGIVLAAMMMRRPLPRVIANVARPRDNQRPVCLDLGSGTGIVGIAAAASGIFSHVLLTDLPSVTPLLRSNAARNAATRPAESAVSVVPLHWEDANATRTLAEQHGPFDVIVGGDLLYRPPVIQPLLAVLSELCGPRTQVLLQFLNMP
jgi:predicted nicotinamide N-methyase